MSEVWTSQTRCSHSQIPELLESEVLNAINSSDNEKSGGSDGIKAELLKFGAEPLEKWLCTIFNKILQTNLHNGYITILLYK